MESDPTGHINQILHHRPQPAALRFLPMRCPVLKDCRYPPGDSPARRVVKDCRLNTNADVFQTVIPGIAPATPCPSPSSHNEWIPSKMQERPSENDASLCEAPHSADTPPHPDTQISVHSRQHLYTWNCQIFWCPQNQRLISEWLKNWHWMSKLRYHSKGEIITISSEKILTISGWWRFSTRKMRSIMYISPILLLKCWSRKIL